MVGQISSRALPFAHSNAIPIQDNAGYGLLLEGSAPQFEGFGPGDWIQTRGSIVRRAGMPMLSVRDIQKFQTSPPPAPRAVSIAELNSIRFIGVLITVQGVVGQSAEAASGDVLRIEETRDSIDVVLPNPGKNGSPGLSAFQAGDHVRVTGIATAYASAPPYNRGYRILLPDLSGITLVDKTRAVPVGLLLSILLAVCGVLGIWWVRERRMAFQRHQLRTLNRLVEEVASAASPPEILSKLNAGVPKVSEGCRVSLYLYNRGSKLLESVASSSSEQIRISPEAPVGPMATGVALCLRNRTLLAMPDTRRSPFFKANGERELQRSMMFVPMFAQNELLGVMELGYAKQEHVFGQEEQTSMQHLANQVATALRLQDQKSIRKQLFRSERLAAGGQLISGVATELRNPLSSILELIGDLKQRRGREYGPEMELIRSEAQRASEIVARLVSFGKIGRMEAQPVDIHALLLGLLRFRSDERKQKGIEILPQILNQRVMVMGSQGQLEQVFLNLLVHAEQAAAEARDIAPDQRVSYMSVSTSLLAKRILFEISYHTQLSEARGADPFSDTEAESGVLGLGLCRAIIKSHGGEIRLAHLSAAQSRFEVELPLIESGQPQISGPAPQVHPYERALTFIAIEPEAATQKQLVDQLSKRGHRVIPVSSADEAADLVQRLKFDASVCSTRVPGMNWVDLYERVRNYVDSFVLLTDGYDAELAKAFQGEAGFVLSKPIDAQHLARIVGLIEQRIRQAEVR